MIEAKIKRRKMELIDLMDDIANFKNNFLTEKNSKIIDLNKVYEKLAKEFTEISETIYHKLSTIFWSHITKKVK